MLRTAIAAVLMLAAATAQRPAQESPQDAFPNVPDPIGVVLDAAGAPVAGARVRLLVEPVPRAGFTAACAQVLERALPHAISGRDGTFVLPLTYEQRRLGAAGEVRVWVVVEHDGFTPWVEPLPHGAWAWLGSRVRLRPEREADRVAFQVLHPRPGEFLWLQRATGLGDLPGRLVEVPADGSCTAALPLLPSPLVLPHDTLPQAIGWIVRRISAAGVGPEIEVPPAPARVELAPLVAPDGVAVHRSDGAAVAGLRALRRLPDRRLWWFAVDGDAPGEGTIAVQADDTLAAPFGQPLPPASERARELRIVAAEGGAIAGARVRLYRLGDGAPGEAVPFGTRPLFTGTSDGSGAVALPERTDPVWARIEAPRRARVELLDPHAASGVVSVVLSAVPTGSVAFRVVDDAGRGVPQASLRFADVCHDAGGLLQRPPLSDANGGYLLEAVPPGEHEVLVIAEGFVPQTARFTVAAIGAEPVGGVPEATVTLVRAAPTRILLVGKGGEAAAFVPVTAMGTAALADPRRPLQRLHTDSRGRLWLRGWRADAELAVSSGNQVALEQHGEVWTGVVGEVEPMIVLPLPADSRLTGSLDGNRSGGGSSGVVPPNDMGLRGVLAMRWQSDPLRTLDLCGAGQPPFRITDAIVQEAPADDDGVRRLGGDVKRRIRLSFLDAEGRPVGDVRVHPHMSHPFVKINHLYGDMTAVAERKLWWQARDDGAYRCLAYHPEYLPLEFEVPARRANVPDPPLELRLQRGAPLSFDVKFDKLPPPDACFMIVYNAAAGAGGGMKALVIDALPRLTPADLGKSIVLRSPTAMPAGDYQVRISFHGVDHPMIERDVTLR